MRLAFAIPGDLTLPTGGYGYDRRLIEGLTALGWDVTHVPLPGGYPFPDEATLAETDRIFSNLPDGTLTLIDGLALGAMPDIAFSNRDRLSLVALVHHPLCDETGLSDDLRETLFQSEHAALKAVYATICTSTTTGRRLADGFGKKATVAPPGTDRAPKRAQPSQTPIILSIGALVARKGHDILIEALSRIADRPWTARIVGPDDRDPGVTAALTAQIATLGLQSRITLAGPVPDAGPELANAQIFALASRHEGYGMAFAEALSHGLPIVACAAGAVPEVVPSQAGSLTQPDDPTAFAEALARLIDNPEAWQSAADAAWKAGSALPDWSDTAKIVAIALKEVHDAL